MANNLAERPWLQIWTNTRTTIRELVDLNPKKCLWLLSWIYGFPLLLQLAQNCSLGESYSAGAIVLGCAILALGIGLLGINIISGLLYWVGTWIGGKGSFNHVRTAVLWSNVPNTFNVVIWIGMLLVFGTSLFTRTFSETYFTGMQLGFVFGAFLVQTVVSIWGFVILLKGLSEVQGFSVWKALLNVLIPFFMVFIGLWAVMRVLCVMGGN